MKTFYVYGRRPSKIKKVGTKKIGGKKFKVYSWCMCGLQGFDPKDCEQDHSGGKKQRTRYLGVIKRETDEDALKAAKKKWPEYQLDLILKKYIVNKKRFHMTGPAFKQRKQKEK